MIALLSPRIWIALAIAAGIAFTVFAVNRWDNKRLEAADSRGYDRRMAEDKAAAEAQTRRNQELQRAAEKKYTVVREAQESFFPVTIKEIVHEAAPMATCPVPPGVRLRLNRAAACARSDSPAACAVDAPVPDS